MTRKYCFVAMPFRPELNFFFLYVKGHLEHDFPMLVERGDADVLTMPLIDKIRGQIARADLVIGDITGNNPNVFYELGLAHAAGKPVVFLTQDPPEKAPVDVRPFECIHYDLGRHTELLAKLDNTVRHVLGARYENLYERALGWLREFNRDTGLSCEAVERETFEARVVKGERTGGIPQDDREDLLLEFLLPTIIADFDRAVARKYGRWVEQQAGRRKDAQASASRSPARSRPRPGRKPTASAARTRRRS